MRANAAVSLLLFFSGFSALVYQVVWARELGLVFGHTVYAVSAVLTSFMAGLALGSHIIGRSLDRRSHPLRVYAWLEISIGGLGLVFWLLPQALDPIYAALYRAAGDRFFLFNLGRFAIASLVLLLPTTLMGGTLPAVSAWSVPREAPGGATIGRFYAFNTLGATAGCLAAGFVLIERLGTVQTQVVAGLVNLSVGVMAFILAAASPRKAEALPHGKSDRPAARPRPSPEEQAHRTPLRQAHSTPVGQAFRLASPLVPILMGVSGCVALIYEVVWTRALVFYTGTTTYAFTTMLAVYLGGLGIGSLAGAAAVERMRNTPLAFIVVQIGIGLTGAVSLIALLSTAPVVERLLPPEASWMSLVSGSLLKGSAAMLLPTLLLGALFPIAVRLAAAGDPVGARVGRLYAANTLGAIVGAACAGFVLIPAFGLQPTLLLCATVNLFLAAGAAAAWASREDSGVPARRWRLPAAAAAGAALLWAGAIPREIVMHVPEGSERLVYYAEGNTATVSVVREVGGSKSLYIDRVPVAGTDPIMLTDQKSLAHLPMLLHPDPRRVLTVGFGSGGASWSFARYDRLAAIDCVEIDPGVFSAAPHLEESNHRVWTDPRFDLIVEDARSYLAYTDRRYDIISTDCTDLRYKSNANLYTVDYFRLCRRRLSPGGIVVVWMPLGGLAEDVFKLALRTFRTVFPHATLWYMANYPTHYALLVGTPEPLRVNLGRVLERMDEDDVRRDLAEIHLDPPARFLNGLLLDESAYAGYAGDGPVNEDRHPILEFLAPRRAHPLTLSRNLKALADRRSDVRRFIDEASRQPAAGGRQHGIDEASRQPAAGSRQHGDREDRVRSTIAALDRGAAAMPALLAGHVIYQRGTLEHAAALAEYRRAAAIDPGDRSIPALVSMVEATARIWIGEHERRIASNRADAADRATLGGLYADAGRLDEARRVLEEAVRIDPGRAVAHRRLANVLAAQGNMPDAIEYYEQAIALEPGSAEAYNDVGLLYLAQGATDRAAVAFAQAVRLDPGSAASHHNLGLVRAAGGDFAGAEAAYRAALGLDPRLIEAYGNLAAVYVRTGRRAQAIEALSALLAVDPSVTVARRMLDDLRAR